MLKDIIIGMPASSKLGLVCVLCKNYSKSVSAIENKPKSSSSGSFQDPKSSFQDHSLNIDGKSPGKKCRHQSESFQDPSQSSFKTTAKYTCTETPFKTQSKASFKTIPSKNEDMTGSFKTPDKSSQKLISFKTIGERVKKLNPRYMVPSNEVSQVISGPQMAVAEREQPLSDKPAQGSRFNPIYMEPGTIQIDSTKDLQMFYPNSLDCIGDMQGEYDIKMKPSVPPVFQQ